MGEWKNVHIKKLHKWRSLHQNDSNDQITKEKCPNYAKNVGDIVHPGGLFARVVSEVVCVDGRIIVKWILQEKWDVLDLIYLAGINSNIGLL
jgi:hypothetical protein